MQNFTCSSCKKEKPRASFHEAQAEDRKRMVTSQCKECRSRTYFGSRYPASVCAQCLQHRQVDKNKICKDCNQDSGLRQCKICLELLPLYLTFYGARMTCKACSRKVRSSREKA